MHHKTIQVSESVIPALKGLNGQKVQDTEKVTNTSIKFKKNSWGSFHAIISSKSMHDVLKAEKIIHLSIKHLEASLDPLNHIEESHEVESARLDLETFYFEMYINRA